MMKDHFSSIAALIALVLILLTSVYFIHMGMHEGTLMGVLITGAVGIAQGIAGIKPTAAPGTTQLTVTDPNPPAPSGQKAETK